MQIGPLYGIYIIVFLENANIKYHPFYIAKNFMICRLFFQGGISYQQEENLLERLITEKF
jgi:uncharacterized protein YegL